MHTIHLKNASILDRLLYLLSIPPGIRKYLPENAAQASIRLYSEVLKDLSALQSSVHKLTIAEAISYKKDYEWLLKWLLRLVPKKAQAKSVNKQFYETINAVVEKLGENIFLMNLIINHELSPEDQLSDLLEDYQDGLLILQRKAEQYVPWEQVKTELNTKHKLV